MNDKYKDLYDQAVQQCIEEGKNDPWLWERKYAELIIRECIMAIEAERIDWGHPVSIGLNLSLATIEEHFGLED